METTGVPVGSKECFLRRVFCRLAVGEESSASVKNLLAISRKELRKALVIPSLPCALGEFLIQLRCHGLSYAVRGLPYSGTAPKRASNPRTLLANRLNGISRSEDQAYSVAICQARVRTATTATIGMLSQMSGQRHLIRTFVRGVFARLRRSVE